MKAIIVAGGRGERLSPITDKIPKPMVEIKGKPILLYIIELLKKYGVSDFVLSLCYLPETITSFFGDGNKFGINIEYTFEDTNNPLGTAGAISLARKLINDTFIVTYADILRELDIEKMIDFHKNSDSFATLNVYKRESKNAKSQIIMDEKNKIINFIERPNAHQLSEEKIWVNGSFYIFEHEVFDFIPDAQRIDFGKDIFPKLLSLKKPIFAFQTTGYFMDIGDLDKLEKARQTFSMA